MGFSDTRQKMEEALNFFRQDLASVRAGRATPALIEKIMVEAYETRLPLVELATISTPNANELLIVPFDQAIIRNLEKALALDRNLGLAPVVDNNIIRLKIPPLSEERRKELVKILGQKIEACRIIIRQIRGEKMRQIKEAAERKELSEDERFRWEKELQKLTDEYNQKIEEIGKSKEEELLAV